MMVQLRTQLTRNCLGQMALICMIACCLFIVGCSSPTEVTIEQELRDRLLATSTKYTDPAKASPIIQVTQTPSSVEQDLTPELRQELDGFSGPTAYRDEPLNVGSDLLGREDPRVVQMSLQKVIHDTTQHNLTLKRARLIPAIDDQAIIQAEAAFDAVFFANAEWGQSNTPQFPTTVGASGDTKTDTVSVSAGIRKPLTTGGQIAFETGTSRTDTNPTNFLYSTAYRPYTLISLEQPLLRNFGSDVNRSQIQLAENAKRQDVQSLRQRILEANLQAEQEYWNLYLARHQLMVRTRLLEGIQGDRDHIKQREIIDADPQSVTQANSEVETARANVIRARQLVREQSDRIKRLINSDALPLTDETLVTPIDDPVTVPIDFSMLDAVTAAMRNRPELRTALLAIEDASIRQRVADNQKLPILNLTASVQFNDLHHASEKWISESRYIDYAIGGQFEAPLGNRAAEAAYSQALLARRDAVLNYQDAAQGVVLEIKNAMRELVTSYDLIGARRAARRAAAENIRAIEAQEGAGAAMTPTFLDRKLRSRQTLAEAEIQEMNAIVSYNVAISQFYLAMGTLLERNGIEFADHLPSK